MIRAGNLPPEMPLYKEDDDIVTQEQFDRMMADWQARNNPTYSDIEDVPEYWQAETRALMAVGAIDGGTPAETNPSDVNMSRDALKAAVICKRYIDGKEV
jgi:hypothetical protein